MRDDCHEGEEDGSGPGERARILTPWPEPLRLPRPWSGRTTRANWDGAVRTQRMRWTVGSWGRATGVHGSPGVAGLERKKTAPLSFSLEVSPGFHWAPTAISALPSPLMSRAAMQTLSRGVRLRAMTSFFQSGLWYHAISLASAMRISSLWSPSTSLMARP